MYDLVPSYLLKIDRAVEHLKEFKRIYAEYVKSEPYTVVSGREGKKEFHDCNSLARLTRERK
jgi:hypothetical protein